MTKRGIIEHYLDLAERYREIDEAYDFVMRRP